MRKTGKILVVFSLFGGLLGLLLTPRLGRAEEPSLELTVDKTETSLGEPITAQVTVHGTSNPPQPILNHTDEFSTQMLGSSSQIQIINGSYSSARTFQFLLMPRSAGQFAVGPAEVVIDGKTYQSDTVTLTVAKGAAPPSDLREAHDQAAFVTAEASESNPYVNQQVVYTFRFYNRVPIRGSELKPPDFSGFRKEQLGDVRHSQKVVNGQAWDINEVRWALFPVSAGNASIGATDLTADLVLPSRRDPLFNEPFFNNDPFFNDMFQQAQRKRFTTDPISLQVRQLPEEGKPSGFSGLVGSAQISAQLSAKDVEAGESATLTLTVQGNGNLRDIPPPKLEGGPDFKIYDDQPAYKSVIGDEGVKGVMTFKKAIVPLKAGDLTIPPFSLSYFDPKTQRYQTASTEPIAIHVRPSTHPESTNLAAPSGNGVLKQDVTLLSHDLMPIDRSLKALRSQTVSPKMRLVFLLLALVPLLGFGVSWLWRRRLERIRSDSGFLRREKAFKSALQGIRRLDQASDREFPERAAHVLRSFIGDKAGIDGGSLTPSDVHPRLEPLGVSLETRDGIRKFLENCDAALYGGQSVTSETRQRSLEELTRLVERAGKEIRS